MLQMFLELQVERGRREGQNGMRAEMIATDLRRFFVMSLAVGLHQGLEVAFFAAAASQCCLVAAR